MSSLSHWKSIFGAHIHRVLWLAITIWMLPVTWLLCTRLSNAIWFGSNNFPLHLMCRQCKWHTLVDTKQQQLNENNKHLVGGKANVSFFSILNNHKLFGILFMQRVQLVWKNHLATMPSSSMGYLSLVAWVIGINHLTTLISKPFGSNWSNKIPFYLLI